MAHYLLYKMVNVRLKSFESLIVSFFGMIISFQMMSGWKMRKIVRDLMQARKGNSYRVPDHGRCIMNGNQFIPILMLCLVLMLATAADARSQDKITADGWLADLDYMIERLEIMHPNMYRNISEEQFSLAASRLRQTIPSLGTHDIFVEFAKLVALLKDGHTSMRLTMEFAETMHIYPVAYYLFDDGLFIMSIDDRYKEYVGWKVVKIGQLSAKEALRKVSQMISADNENSRIARTVSGYINFAEVLRFFGAVDNTERLVLHLVDPEGRERDLEIRAEPLTRESLFRVQQFQAASDSVATMNMNCKIPLPLWLRNLEAHYWFEYLPDQKTLYVQINQMWDSKDESFSVFCERLFRELDERKTESLIIDIRHNIGGNHIEMPLIKGIIQRPHIDSSDSLFLIIGPVVFSAAQHLTSQLERYTNATLVGEPTAGKPNHDGSNRLFSLPNSGLRVSCSTYHYQDSEPFDFRLTTSPDFYVPLTYDDYRNNRDSVMEWILAFDSVESLPDLRAELKRAYQEAGFEGAKRTYTRLKDLFDRNGASTESAVNDFVYWLFSKGTTDHMMQFIMMNLEAYPNAFMVYEVLGDCQKKAGETEEARKSYEKCLELCPANVRIRRRLALMELEKRQESHHK
jgi:tetratricopeptide (TPR) repeat protein